MNSRLHRIATETFTRTRPDGSIVYWHQEDELGCPSKEEAIAIIQRTINFWVPKLAGQLQERDGVTAEEALTKARVLFREGFKDTINDTFPARFGLVLDDLNFEVDY